MANITYRLGANLYLNITNRCSNRCSFCIRQNGNSVGDADDLWLKQEPTREEILKAVFENDLSKFHEIVFCGYGEPLERLDDVVWLARQIKTKNGAGIKIRVNTNGQADLIHNRRTAPELEGAVDAVSISLNAPNAEKYQELCHSQFGKTVFDAIIAYTKDCVKYVPDVTMSVVDVMPKEDIEECAKIAKAAGAKFRVRELIK